MPQHNLHLIEIYTVPLLEQRMRLSDIKAGVFTTIASRKAFKNAIKAKKIYLNDALAHTSNYIQGGEIIKIYKDITTSKKPKIHIDIEIAYEDDYLAIVHKPAGIVVSGNKKYTLENALPTVLKKSTQNDALQRPKPIHRLDYPTSGCLLIGKTASITMTLNKLFENRNIRKTYYAVTLGIHKKREDSISFPIDNKTAKSTFCVIQTLASQKYSALNLVKLKPHTGRKHQLRKHLAAIGNPIMGDTLYGNKNCSGVGNGLYLHAFSLSFTHPITQAPILVEIPYTKKFKTLFKA